HLIRLGIYDRRLMGVIVNRTVDLLRLLPRGHSDTPLSQQVVHRHCLPQSTDPVIHDSSPPNPPDSPDDSPRSRSRARSKSASRIHSVSFAPSRYLSTCAVSSRASSSIMSSDITRS